MADFDPDIVAAVARRLRINFHGLVRPLWEDLPSDRRQHWIVDAQRLLRSLNKDGLSLVWKDDGK